MAPTAKNTKSRAFGWLSAAVAALALPSVACGPITPVTPTWKDDVRPLLISRCMRCHDGQMREDKLIAAPRVAPSTYNFDYVDLPSPLPAGLATLITPLGLGSLRGKVVRRMPPPPNEALEDWQIEIIEAWAINPI